MIAYKGFNKHEDGTLWCMDFQYEVGNTYKHNGKIKLCESGFHACHELHQVWQFYPNNGNNVFYEVECGGEIIESQYNDGKIVCSEISLTKEIDTSDIDKFDSLCQFIDGLAIAFKSKKIKHNYIKTNGKLLSSRWFDSVYPFSGGNAIVRIDNKFNLIDTNGKILSDIWFDNVGEYRNGLRMVKSGYKYNFIKGTGEFLSEQWFDNVLNYDGILPMALINGYWYQINTKGELIKNQ